jgi:alanine dehydrogenase
MIIGVPKEILSDENRVALTPDGAATLRKYNHQVLMEKSAGSGSGFTDESYASAGAALLERVEDIFEKAELILKVKDPQPVEYDYFKNGRILFTFLHLAPKRELTEAILKAKIIGIAYETVQLENGCLPLLKPMSEIAGRMAVQVGAQLLTKPHGGKGLLFSGASGVPAAKVTIIGGGIAGSNAAKVAVGMGADVVVLEKNREKLKTLDSLFGSCIKTAMSTKENIAGYVEQADLLIGAALQPGARAPKLVTEDMVKKMSYGSVIVDIAIDQGGCFETVDRATTHDQPTYVKHGIVHYSVANMPGAVPRTATIALTNATFPYILSIANMGCKEALLRDAALCKGVNVFCGHVTCKAVADAHQLAHSPLLKVIRQVRP